MYHENEEIRKEIDAILHENATLFQNIGTDSSKLERELAKAKEISNLKSVRDLDPEYIDTILFGLDVAKANAVKQEVVEVKFQEFDWADDMTTDVKACSIDDDECEACGS